MVRSCGRLGLTFELELFDSADEYRSMKEENNEVVYSLVAICLFQHSSFFICSSRGTTEIK